MIAYIKGKIEGIAIDKIVVETYGIGYEISFARCDVVRVGQEVQIFTYQHLREDENTLYGFLSKSEKELFVRLISVKGLGPKTALGILRGATYDTVIAAIEQGDVSFIKSMPGIGAKTASQIILDLKGKLVETDSVVKSASREMDDAIEALKTFGYKQSECAQVLKYFAQYPNQTTDEYVKLGLQFLIAHKR